MTRLQVCNQPCDQRVIRDGQQACAQVLCCGSDLPSPEIFRAMLASPGAICRHPSGDLWKGLPADLEAAMALVPPPRHSGDTDDVPNEPGRRALHVERLAICSSCTEYARMLACRIRGPLWPVVKLLETTCPRGIWTR